MLRVCLLPAQCLGVVPTVLRGVKLRQAKSVLNPLTYLSGLKYFFSDSFCDDGAVIHLMPQIPEPNQSSPQPFLSELFCSWHSPYHQMTLAMIHSATRTVRGMHQHS